MADEKVNDADVEMQGENRRGQQEAQ